MSLSRDARAQLIGKLRASQVVNDPYLGEGTPAAFEADGRLWPGDRWSVVEATGVVEADGRRFEEFRFTPADGGKVLPVGFMFETRADGRSSAIVYSDHHLVEDRGPIHPKTPGIHPWRSGDDVLRHYFDALNGNRLEDVLDRFAEDGYFRHSNDETFVGRDRLRIDFTKMLGKSGIRVDYCRFTDDGVTCAADVYMPSGRPSVAVYERTARFDQPGHKLKAVRIYM
ncbi:MAG: nuclear transport factor 2 family protein [Mesorhizobium sp.]